MTGLTVPQAVQTWTDAWLRRQRGSPENQRAWNAAFKAGQEVAFALLRNGQPEAASKVLVALDTGGLTLVSAAIREVTQ